VQIQQIVTCVLIGLWSLSAQAATIAELCDVQGVRGNELKGIGLVVGLAGTGDSSSAAIRAQERALRRLGIEVSSPQELASENSAVVIVTTTLPAFVKEGTQIDVQVSSLYDAESLEGGVLLETLLEGIDNEVYAVANGPISVGGFNTGAGGAQVRQNHVTVGRIPNGAYVEREVPSTITDGERVMFLLKDPDFVTANRIQDVINDQFGTNSAAAFGAGAINVRIPTNRRADLVGFIAEVQQLNVESRQPARVVMNERTGTIVVGGNVIVKPCQVAHGNITIQVATTPIVTQPPPLSPGETVVTELDETEVQIDDAHFMPIQGTTAGEVAQALNQLKITPRDMIAIFQAIQQAGALEADLEIM